MIITNYNKIRVTFEINIDKRQYKSIKLEIRDSYVRKHSSEIITIVFGKGYLPADFISAHQTAFHLTGTNIDHIYFRNLDTLLEMIFNLELAFPDYEFLELIDIDFAKDRTEYFRRLGGKHRYNS